MKPVASYKAEDLWYKGCWIFEIAGIKENEFLNAERSALVKLTVDFIENKLSAERKSLVKQKQTQRKSYKVDDVDLKGEACIRLKYFF